MHPEGLRLGLNQEAITIIERLLAEGVEVYLLEVPEGLFIEGGQEKILVEDDKEPIDGESQAA